MTGFVNEGSQWERKDNHMVTLLNVFFPQKIGSLVRFTSLCFHAHGKSLSSSIRF